nr:hypothetical protein GCM10025730_33570 [Promicromonospora thailandica]
MTEPTSAEPSAEQPPTGGVGTLDTVVLDVPDLTAEADFWKALTSGTVSSESDDWITVVTPDRWGIGFQLAPDLVAPQWPGQEHPQQVHLDLYVPDLAAASARAVELGASVLRENEQWVTLADPAGHPFDVCLKEGTEGVTVMGATFDCPDASGLAGFWAQVLGVPVTYDADGVAMLGGSRPLLFQSVEGYNAPAGPILRTRSSSTSTSRCRTSTPARPRCSPWAPPGCRARAAASGCSRTRRGTRSAWCAETGCTETGCTETGGAETGGAEARLRADAQGCTSAGWSGWSNRTTRSGRPSISWA